LKSTKSIAVLIPARLDGVRLPKKVLFNFFDLPMIEHVRRRAELNKFKVDVYVVTGDDEVANCINSFGGKVLRSYREHSNGTSRCAEAAEQLQYENFIVAQGDEILLLPRHIDSLIENIVQSPEVDCFNAVAPIKNIEELHDVSVVKCLIDNQRNILFMFRVPPISNTEEINIFTFSKVLGLFAFRKETLIEIAGLETTPFESLESIEQMRMIENCYQINSIKLDRGFPSVNVPSDINVVNHALLNDAEQANVLKSVIDAIKS